MDENRNEYEKVKSVFQEYVNHLIEQISAFDPSVSHLKPKDCIFRINRDVRFSKDKSPYKTNMGAYMCKVGKKGNGAGYYIHLEPGKSFLAGGIWMPEKNLLDLIRQEIDYGWEEWNRITTSKSINKLFPQGIVQSEKAARPPKGYDSHNPAIEAIKLKSFVYVHPLTDQEIMDPATFPLIIKCFRELRAVVDFLNRAI
jgi:uncharacterized protein (TIGR02453 family)